MESTIWIAIIGAIAGIVVAFITKKNSQGASGEDNFVTTLTNTINEMKNDALLAKNRISALEASDKAKDLIIKEQAEEIEQQAQRIAQLEKHNNDTALFVAEVIAWAKWDPAPPPRELPKDLVKP